MPVEIMEVGEETARILSILVGLEDSIPFTQDHRHIPLLSLSFYTNNNLLKI